MRLQKTTNSLEKISSFQVLSSVTIKNQFKKYTNITNVIKLNDGFFESKRKTSFDKLRIQIINKK